MKYLKLQSPLKACGREISAIGVVRGVREMIDFNSEPLKNQTARGNTHVMIEYYPSVSNYINGGEPIMLVPGNRTRVVLYMGEERLDGSNVYEAIASQTNSVVAEIDFE